MVHLKQCIYYTLYVALSRQLQRTQDPQQHQRLLENYQFFLS